MTFDSIISQSFCLFRALSCPGLLEFDPYLYPMYVYRAHVMFITNSYLSSVCLWITATTTTSSYHSLIRFYISCV